MTEQIRIVESNEDASASSSRPHFESNARNVGDIKTCLQHHRVTVNYIGPTCPFCLALDEIDFLRSKSH